jgi:adhesin/invasin
MDVAVGSYSVGRLAILINSGCMRTAPGPKPAALLALAANPNGVTADGVSTTTVTVNLRDANGAASPRQTVTLSVSGGNNTLNRVTGLTNSSGVFTANLATTVAETKSVRALAGIAGSPYGSGAVTFVAGGAASMSTRIAASPRVGVRADNISSAEVAVRVVDAFGNPVPNELVVLSSSAGDAATFGRRLGTTDPNGLFLTTVSSTLEGVQTISATVP